MCFRQEPAGFLVTFCVYSCPFPSLQFYKNTWMEGGPSAMLWSHPIGWFILPWSFILSFIYSFQKCVFGMSRHCSRTGDTAVKKAVSAWATRTWLWVRGAQVFGWQQGRPSGRPSGSQGRLACGGGVLEQDINDEKGWIVPGPRGRAGQVEDLLVPRPKAQTRLLEVREEAGVAGAERWGERHGRRG